MKLNPPTSIHSTVLLLAVAATTCNAQSPGSPFDGVIGSWIVTIQVTGGSQIPPGAQLPSTLHQILVISPGKQLQEQTTGDVMLGLVNSAGVGNWNYIQGAPPTFSSCCDSGVKFVSLVSSKDGTPLGMRTTVIRLTPGGPFPSQSITGTYKSTLADYSGNVIYQVAGTLTGVALHVDIADENLT